MTFSNSERFADKPVVDYERGEPLTKPETTAVRLRVGYGEDYTAVDLLTELLRDPAVERLQALVIGDWAEEPYESPAKIMEALVTAAPRLTSLNALFIGDISSEESEVSWIRQSDLSPLWEAFPRLEHFQVRGSQGLRLGPLRHSQLRRLVVESGGLPRSVLQEIVEAHLPLLEHLELYLGDSGYGWDGSLADILPLLEAGRFPRLRYLGLRDSEIVDEIAQAVATASILEQIDVLDLSLGTLGDEGGRALLASPQLARLQKLDLHHHYLSAELIRRFEQLPIEVDLSDPRDEDKYGRFVAVGE